MLRSRGTITFFVLHFIVVFFLAFPAVSSAQNRIEYHNTPLFMSGANVAWINFSADIGPGTTNFNGFASMFDSVHARGGNVMRLWLHTNGAKSPAFGSDLKVTDPGTGTVSDLKQILDLAAQRDVGLILCLWSFDMLRESFGTTITDRSYLLLTDNSAREAYIRNALVPMVQAVAGHPAIVAWEVFNEAEGMSDEHGWSGIRHVSMQTIQLFVNRVAGTIHRTDPSARVTTGAWSFIAMSDVTTLAKAPDIGERLRTMSPEERAQIEEDFSAHYGLSIPAEDILMNYAGSNFNYYSDERLIAAGGDEDGTLDFYTVHYYDWGGTSISPFHYPYSHWGLDKPLIVAEFYLKETFGIPYQQLYDTLISTGYAGALSWQWANSTQRELTKQVLSSLFVEYPGELVVDQTPGTLYAFAASSPEVEIGQPCTLSWSAAWGSTVTLNGVPVPTFGDTTVTPTETTEYVLSATGTVNTTLRLTVTAVVTDVAGSPLDVPGQYRLDQNYPNPFNPATTIRYGIPGRETVRLTVFNVLGVEVARLVDDEIQTGEQSVQWDASGIPTGVYYYRLVAGDFVQNRKMVVMK